MSFENSYFLDKHIILFSQRPVYNRAIKTRYPNTGGIKKMQPKFKKMLYGGDYNPNQWPKEIWDEDMKLFHQAGINSTTINVFSWAKIQPSENEYDFTELDEIVDTLTKEDVHGNIHGRTPGMDGTPLSGSGKNRFRRTPSQIRSSPQCLPEQPGFPEICKTPGRKTGRALRRQQKHRLLAHQQ